MQVKGQLMTLVPHPCKEGSPPYLVVRLSKNGWGENGLVHRLVLEAFVGPCPEGQEGCHNNGDVLNCRLTNLRWDTKSSNNLDRVKHGTHWQAAKVVCLRVHKLVDPNLIEARKPDRVCLACDKGRRLSYRLIRQGLSFDLQELCDQKYREIMGIVA